MPDENCAGQDPVDGTDRHGPVRFDFNDEYHDFAGRYLHCSGDIDAARVNWTGTRICDQQPGEYPEWMKAAPDLRAVAFGIEDATPPVVGQESIARFQVESAEHVDNDITIDLTAQARLPEASLDPEFGGREACTLLGDDMADCRLSQILS